MKMKDNNNQFLKYLENQDTQILCDIKLFRELIKLLEYVLEYEHCEFDYENENINQILVKLWSNVRDREIKHKKVKELIEKMRKERKREK